MSNYVNENGIFNHGKWQRDQYLNEGPGNDPALKSLRIRIPGEKFPELTSWWEYEPEDIMTYVYWHQGQLPPTGPAYDKEWKSVVKQLHAKYPIPPEALGKVDMDADTERAISVDAPDRYSEATNVAGQTKQFQPGDMWSNDFDYVGMLKAGANAPDISGENVDLMNDLHASFTDVNYHTEGRDLGNAIDWVEDAKGVEDIEKANEFMEMFRAACAKTLEDIERR
tara:strand:+ start:272 stop:946 length:675 start_codon:yes stop_codon:yes gene_type:complete